MLKLKIKNLKSHIYAACGSLILGWSFYFVAYSHLRNHWSRKKSVLIVLAFVLLVYLADRIGKALYHYLIDRWSLSDFWRREFGDGLDRLFLAVAASSLVVAIKSDLGKLAALSVLFLFCYLLISSIFKRHQFGHRWQMINSRLFALGYVIFITNSVFQYIASQYYILNSQIRIPNIVLLRAWAVSMFWLAGFALIGYLFSRLKGAKKYLLAGGWVVFYLLVLVAEVANAGILYYSGLYLNPVAVFHAKGASAVVLDTLPVYAIIGILLLPIIPIVMVLRSIKKSLPQAPAKYWQAYLLALLMMALVSLVPFSFVITHTPEYIVGKSFLDYWLGQYRHTDLSPQLTEKLRRFGLDYQPDKFYVNNHEDIFDPGKPLLSGKFQGQKPNIIYIALESFSGRLSDVYNPELKGITPGLAAMAADKQTSVFHNFYNASTPTITGLIAQLCSFLPPTGHQEISNTNLKTDHLLCLPRILKDQAGYRYIAYITAVEKEYSGKNTIFASMGVDEVYGTAEIAQRVNEAPKSSWGYSDHQLFPFMEKLIAEKGQPPFMVILSTVDSHQPFTMSKDVVNYKAGDSNLLNAIHTTDDAFRIFWDEFKASDLSKNTIVVAVADHALFPRSYTEAKAYLPKEGSDKSMTFYDENVLMIYVPDNLLSKNFDTYSSSIDLAPTLLELLGVNSANAFDGQSIFSRRRQYPNLLGMHEFGLYINQIDAKGKRQIAYNMPQEIDCQDQASNQATSSELTLCEYLQFYKWKRQMMEQGRLWYKK